MLLLLRLDDEVDDEDKLRIMRMVMNMMMMSITRIMRMLSMTR